MNEQAAGPSSSAATNTLQRLCAAGVSVWLDDLGRDRIVSGELARLVDLGVRGVTTNPTIFAKVIGDGTPYRADLDRLHTGGASVDEAVRDLVTDDVRRACDVFADLYEQTQWIDGRVSLEVDPRLARDTDATVNEARTLWRLVDRPNLLVKVPATPEGLPAITTLLAEGISVNVTLIFALRRYEEVVQAWLAGLEAAAAAGHDLRRIGSVASFFVSRVDTAVDQRLDAIAERTGDRHAALRGRAALANAHLAYRDFEQMLATKRWAALAEKQARPQRPLWASTGTKNPAYPDTLYVDQLVAPHTVNTMPSATLDAVIDHGRVDGNTVSGSYGEAERTMSELAEAGVDYDEVVAALERDGVRTFADSWAELAGAVKAALAQTATSGDRNEGARASA